MVKNILKTFVKLILNRGVGSQFGEDKVLLTILPKKGRYVDVGAYHPHLYSNTYALYRGGWSGIAIEPNPKLGILWKIFRPRDKFVNAAIGSRGVPTYYMFKDPAYNGFSMIPNSPLVATKQIPTVPLRQIIKEPIDLLCVDCEGMDYEVLQTHDWTIKPSVVVVEDKDGGECQRFLEEKGYTLYQKCALSLIFKHT
jgi:FkbM family methyltransferase